MKDGFIKVAAVTPELKVGDVEYNVTQMIQEMDKAYEQGARLLVFPELCLTGYTCSLQIINHIIRRIFSSFLPRNITQHNQAPFPLTNSIPVLRKAFDIYCDYPKHFLHIPEFPYRVFPLDY